MQCQPTHVMLAVSRDVGRNAAHTFQPTHLIWEPELHPLTVKQIIDQKRTITEERSEDRSQKNDQRIDHRRTIRGSITEERSEDQSQKNDQRIDQRLDPYKNDQKNELEKLPYFWRFWGSIFLTRGRDARMIMNY